MSSEPVGPPRVVMLVANPFTHDTRVEKEARTLAESGYDVHVICFLRTGLAAEEQRHGMTVHRFPVGLRPWLGLALLAFLSAGRLALLHRLAEPIPARRGGGLAVRLGAVIRACAVAMLVIAFAARLAIGALAWPVRPARRALARRATPFLAIVRRRGWRVAARVGRHVRRVGGRIRLAIAAARVRWQVAKSRVRARASSNRRWRAARRRAVLARAALRRRWRPTRRRLILARAGLRRRWRALRRRAILARAARRRRRNLRIASANGGSGPARARRRLKLHGRILSANLDFARLALSLDPDVVHAHDLNTLAAGVIVKELSGARLVYDSHELFLERNIGQSSRALDRCVWGPVERHAIGRCDHVISVSEGICRLLERRYGLERVELVRNVQRYEPPPADRARLLHDAFALDRRTRIGIYAGGIVRHRGLETMIDSAAHLERTVFVIMGYAHDQSYLDSLEERARAAGVLGSRVFFHPAVPTDEVVGYVAAADIGMVPTENACLSYYHEASNKIFHCMMAGVPLAMSDHPEKRLLVERHGVGIVFDETRPPADIALVVERFLGDRDRYRAAQEACVEAARVLNWEHEEQTLRRIYARSSNSEVG
ncbi:MAG: glycosyltransferase [Thermoleophilaceae bacterium]